MGEILAGTRPISTSWVVFCDLDPLISTYPLQLREEDLLVKLDLRPQHKLLLEVEWIEY